MGVPTCVTNSVSAFGCALAVLWGNGNCNAFAAAVAAFLTALEAAASSFLEFFEHKMFMWASKLLRLVTLFLMALNAFLGFLPNFL